MIIVKGFKTEIDVAPESFVDVNVGVDVGISVVVEVGMVVEVDVEVEVVSSLEALVICSCIQSWKPSTLWYTSGPSVPQL